MEHSSSKRPAESIHFRLLCPASRTGAIIGKGGSVIRHLQSVTGSKIRVIDDIPVPSEERVVLIISPNEQKQSEEHKQDNEEEAPTSGQMALVRVLERIVFGDDYIEELDKGDNSEGLCRIILRKNQVDYLMMSNKGGVKIIQIIREESLATIIIVSTEQIPPCVFPGDIVLQINGKFSNVKKALVLITNCLQENDAPPTWEECPFPQPDYHSMEYHQWDHPVPINPMPVFEEEVVFRLLCPPEKVGSLIGKGGAVVRVLQNETGASIKVSDPTNDSEERVVVISARENLERGHSLAQDAVMRVHNRIVEIGFEPSGEVIARLLVHSPYIGRLLGKGGHTISEIRRATNARILVFAKDQATMYEPQHDEIVQVKGNLKTVQDALFQVTSRIREAMFPGRIPYQGMGGGPPPPFMGPYGPEHYHSPMSWTPQPPIDGHPGGMVPDVNHGPIGSENPGMINANVEIVVPQMYLGQVYGENGSNLNYIKQVSGANVVVHDPKAGTTEGLVVVSGTSEQAHFAQSLLHAFILCGQS